ncbi:MAG: addiction module protein [Chloroherpetonaceae bacterium]|nr:addiction module protein [Chloroherpetonaceae bacterium]
MAIPIDLSKLSKDERFELLEAVWESLDKEIENEDFSEEEKKILDERLESFRKNPDKVKDWEEVKQKYEKK